MILVATSLVGCADAPAATSAGDPTSDKLAQILDRGTLVLSTDLDYAPQSFAVADAPRAPTRRATPTN